MVSFEALYGKKCISSLCWDEVGEIIHLGLKVIIQTVDKIRIIENTFGQHKAGRRVGLT